VPTRELAVQVDSELKRLGQYTPIRSVPVYGGQKIAAQMKFLKHHPEIIIGTWMAARTELPDLTEEETRETLERLDPLWDALFPAEQERVIRMLVERVEIRPEGADIRLRIAGLTSLVRDLGGAGESAVAAAA